MGRPRLHDNLIGNRYGRWVVLAPADRIHGQRAWKCRCECGTLRTIPDYSLKTGISKSCGCGRIYSTKHGDARKAKKHGVGKHAPEYRIWAGMKSRCYNQNGPFYSCYGGRGINVCERWKNSYPAFLEDMGRRPSRNHSIDRLDNDKGYYKDNCAWRTITDQLNNRRSTHWIEVDGHRKTITQWAREIGVNSCAIIDRLKRGWSVHDAVTTPSLGNNRKLNGESHAA